jgi:hypothetical protein
MVNPWHRLILLINEHGDARVADAEKGGSDPDAIPSIESHLQATHARLASHIQTLRRACEDSKDRPALK